MKPIFERLGLTTLLGAQTFGLRRLKTAKPRVGYDNLESCDGAVRIFNATGI
jgi:hypothetical protein